MARSDEQIVSDDLLDDTTATNGEATTTTSGKTDSDDPPLSDRLSGTFSIKAFLLSTVLIAIGVVGGGAIPLVGTLGSLGGLFAASFGIGLVSSERRYLETAVAGGGIIGVSFAASLLSTGVLPVGMRFFREYGLAFGAVGVVLGVVIGLLGHYFGRDLRDGLTQEIS